MVPTNLKTGYRLSTVIIIAAIASAGGLFGTNLYRDNKLIKAAWQGNDFVMLFVVVPLITMSLVLFRRGSQRAQ